MGEEKISTLILFSFDCFAVLSKGDETKYFVCKIKLTFINRRNSTYIKASLMILKSIAEA